MAFVFEWDPDKEQINFVKHGLSFEDAQDAFYDPKRVVIEDEEHSQEETRFHCIGMVGERVATIRFTIRQGVVRIIGAGYWREGRSIYEKANSV